MPVFRVNCIRHDRGGERDFFMLRGPSRAECERFLVEEMFAPGKVEIIRRRAKPTPAKEANP